MRNKDISKEQLIMRTALTMIAEVGLAGLKMNDLAKNANLATGTVYIYFSSKEELIRSLYGFIFQRMSLDLLQGQTPEMDTCQKIQHVCLNYVSELIKHPEYKIFIEQFFRSPYFTENDADVLDITAYTDPVLQLVLLGQQEKIIKNAPADLLIQLTRGALEKYAHYISYSKKELDPDEFQIVFDFIWDGGGITSTSPVTSSQKMHPEVYLKYDRS
jgi:TetR/AcrR family transcriptional repressor of multidrug resistance operon